MNKSHRNTRANKGVNDTFFREKQVLLDKGFEVKLERGLLGRPDYTLYFSKEDEYRLIMRRYKNQQPHYFCSECAVPVPFFSLQIDKHVWSRECSAKVFNALKMGDMIPGKGKNKYSNFILYLGGIEALKAKTKAKLIEEKGSINPVDKQVDREDKAP